MRGAVLYGAHDVRFEERDTPKIIHPTDAVIRTSATAPLTMEISRNETRPSAKGPAEQYQGK